MGSPVEQVILDIVSGLSTPLRNKDALVKLLKQAESALSGFEQSSSPKTAIGQLRDIMIKNSLLQPKDKDVRLLVAACVSEVIRLLAPEPPFDDEQFKGIFRLFIGVFAELSDTASPYYTRRSRILKTVADVKCCVLMLDIGCMDLVLEMFKVFFSAVRENHQPDIFQAMLSIMSLIIEEKVSQPLLEVILCNLLKDDKGASFRLAISVIQNCTTKLEPSVRVFLTSCISNRDASGSGLKKFYHNIILVLFQYAPETLFTVIPNLTQELLTDQVDVRLEAVWLVGKLLALSKLRLGHECRVMFIEFLKRFSDKSADVRSAAIESAKACYVANTSEDEAREILSALEGRLLDFDDKVRTQAVSKLCDMASFNLARFPSEVILRVIERLRDKKVSVRKITMQKLLELYRTYCDKCSKGLIMFRDHYERIPSRIVLLCYDKDCKDFRPQNMELVLSEDLFPTSLSLKERAKHWVAFFSFFTLPQIKALTSILCQKQRLQKEMLLYLCLREKEKENGSEEVHKRILASFVKMSNYFSDTSVAEECFQQMHQMKDNNIFKTLHQLVDESTTSVTAQSVKDSFLKRIGAKHPNYEFFEELWTKCSQSLFTEEHILVFLGDVQSRSSSGGMHVQSLWDLLFVISDTFPHLFRGSEDYLLKLFSEGTTISNVTVLQILAKLGPHISINLSVIYPLLERICLEGTRVESKFAVSAIASLIDPSIEEKFSNLCKELVSSLQYGSNTPTVLQSLGCISQYSSSTFEKYEEQISQFIFQNIFYSMEECDSPEEISVNPDPMCSPACMLRVYGLKTLVKSFLPNKVARVRHQLKAFLGFLENMIQKNGSSEGISLSENDKAHLRLAAAKSILRLATRWDLHVSPNTFRATIMMARDGSATIRKSFLSKTHKLLTKHAIPSRYACAFAIGSFDCLGDVRDDSMKYFAQFIKEYNKEAHHLSPCTEETDGGPMTNCPEYIVVFLVHILAHDPSFPSVNCVDEVVYAEFCSPLIVALRSVINPEFITDSKRNSNASLSYMLGIFRAIKKAEDAVEPQFTLNLHILSSIGLLVVKALGHCKSSSETPRLVLLPSSFYKACPITTSREALSHSGSFIDENFVRRILKTVDAQFASSGFRKCGKSQVHGSNSDGLKNSSNHLERQNGTCLHKSKYRKDKRTNGHGLQKVRAPQTISSKAKVTKTHPVAQLASPEQLHGSSAIQGSTNAALESADLVLGKSQKSGQGKEQVSSSCDSASTKLSFLESQVILNNSQTGDNIPQQESHNRGFATEPMEMSKNCINTHRISMEHGDKGESLIGHHIRVWSPIDKCFSSGTVDSYDSQSGSYKINYDNGDVELLHLENEKWEAINDRPPVEKEACNLHPRVWSVTSSSSLDDARDVFREEDAQEQSTTLNKRIGNSSEDIGSSRTGAAKGKNKRSIPSVSGQKIMKSRKADYPNKAARRSRLRRA